MVLQLESLKKRERERQRKSLSRKIGWALTLVTLFVCVQTVFQTKNVVQHMQLRNPSDLSVGVPVIYNESLRLASKALGTKVWKNEHSSVGSTPFRKWAYLFLIGGCNPTQPEYRGFLYNVMANVFKLRKMGSTTDVVVFIQMSVQGVHRKLPDFEEKLLTKMNIKFQYIPTFASQIHENFYALMMEKFRILSLTEYSRVIFLDSDQWLLCNLDYIFELSEPPLGEASILKENMLLAWKLEPCNGGFFMFAPKEGDYEQIQEIIRKRESEILVSEYPYWNETIGWGHQFHENDKWKAVLHRDHTTHLLWDWHGAFTDQGLIYYWAKYYKQSVSLIIHRTVEQWGSCEGMPCKENEVKANFGHLSCEEGGKQPGTSNFSPYRDIFHFVGRTKPWIQDRQKISKVKSEWFHVLEQIENEYFLETRLSDEIQSILNGSRIPSVGSYPVQIEMYNHVKEKKRRGWNAYETLQDVEDRF